MNKHDRRTRHQPRRWEHATVQMPPNLDLLPNVLDQLGTRFGGELLALLPTMVSSGLLVGGQPQAQALWVLLLRFPAGQRVPALAFVRGAAQAEAAPADVAGSQTLTLTGA